MYNLSNSTISNQIVSHAPIKCISKSLLELHMKSVIDFSQYTYIRTRINNLTWTEIIIKVVCCLLSIFIALFGNLFTIYNMIIKPKLKSGTNLNYEYYVSNTSGVSTILNKCSLIRRSKEQELRSFSNEKEKESDTNNKEKKFFITKISRPIKKNSVNFFILNLCFCDLMIVIWCSWVHMVNSVNDNWIMGAFFCKGSSYVQSK